jgi:hypothetical protein
MYWYSILTYLIWPVLIIISYLLVIFVLRKMKRYEQKQEIKGK